MKNSLYFIFFFYEAIKSRWFFLSQASPNVRSWMADKTVHVWINSSFNCYLKSSALLTIVFWKIEPEQRIRLHFVTNTYQKCNESAAAIIILFVMYKNNHKHYDIIIDQTTIAQHNNFSFFPSNANPIWTHVPLSTPNKYFTGNLTYWLSMLCKTHACCYHRELIFFKQWPLVSCDNPQSLFENDDNKLCVGQRESVRFFSIAWIHILFGLIVCLR